MSKEDFPDYYELIKQPVTLSSMLKKGGKYCSGREKHTLAYVTKQGGVKRDTLVKWTEIIASTMDKDLELLAR